MTITLHDCKICRHVFSPEAHYNHCPVCNTLAMQVCSQSYALSSDGSVVRPIANVSGRTARIAYQALLAINVRVGTREATRMVRNSL